MPETFDFGEALARLRAGAKLARIGWNGKGMWVELQAPDSHSKMTKPYIFLNYPPSVTSADEERVPWAPSQTDVLASDWMVA